MTVKALRKQLMAAIAMVVVAAVALSSSTYAWFVTNSTVTADGMTVQATAENGIEIKEKTAGSAWASAATGLHSTGNSLAPTSTSDVVNWYHASALAKDKSDVDMGTIETLTLTEYTGVAKVAEGHTVGYYIHDQFQIRATNTAASNLKVSALTVTGTQDSLAPGLRVAIKVGGVLSICAPIAEATLSYSVGDGRTSVTAVDIDGLKAVTLADSVTTAGIDVDVFVFFEGEDGKICTDNIPDTLQKLSITLDFTATL